ncbi:hypothetical protein EUGRSUZ_A02193 [Eucalyptus grandis]|uniref:Uncharacterized protein n=2 Tax=Eucalyptus grandis TaxID=71139 RepID=A0ACC3M6X7_EUCGR|nr:hypothetical protein EUGRSUZ_A02193 [Eucalyptus grandis]
MVIIGPIKKRNSSRPLWIGLLPEEAEPEPDCRFSLDCNLPIGVSSIQYCCGILTHEKKIFIGGLGHDSFLAMESGYQTARKNRFHAQFVRQKLKF